MRTNIYYWKCDSPLSIEEKQGYNTKYVLADISNIVESIAADYFGEPADSIENTGSAGNHYTYLIHHNEKKLFFRADDGKVNDDYMLAEGAAIQIAAKNSIPVPQVLACDISQKLYPIRYQILENIPYPDINKHYQAGTLHGTDVARQAGHILAKLHNIPLKGFGFFNTNQIKTNGEIKGLDNSNHAYFYKCLDRHLSYLQDAAILSTIETTEIEQLFNKHDNLLTLPQGSMIHKDMAFWNLLGSPSVIKAVIDWDDVISGDPVDDLAILRCFYDDPIWIPLLEAYQEIRELPDDFDGRLAMYLTRNMLWKTMIRHFMGYFDMKGDFFILNNTNRDSLETFTRKRLAMGVEMLHKL